MTADSITRLFGTDGIRGNAGRYPLDDATVYAIGRALAANLNESLGRPPVVVVGRDTRESGPAIEESLAVGARSEGAQVISAGVITTPGVAFLARNTPFDAGIVISASHNPYQDNGIKVFSPSGKKLADEMERKIEADVSAVTPSAVNARRADRAVLSSPGQPNGSFVEAYIRYLTDGVASPLRLDGVSLVIDCANGAASAIAPEVFGRLGATLDVLAAEPNGRNINDQCGSLHPESLQRAVVERRAGAGIAFDGDADRVVFVDHTGGLVDGDHLMLILATFLKSQSRLKGDVVVATVMSNLGLEIELSHRGIRLQRTSVGDRYVLEELLKVGGSLGGEQSGHIILPDISLAGDGIITALEVLAAVNHSGKSLARLASDLVRCPQTLINLPVREKPDLESLPEVKQAMDDLRAELGREGRLLVRYSGTENLARVMVEARTQAQTEEAASRIAGVIRRAIGV